MKKLFIAMAAIALVASMGSCKKEKEGKYAPGKQISQIEEEYYSDEDGAYTLLDSGIAQKWNWDGDQLASIETENGQRIETLTYDSDGRIVSSVLKEDGQIRSNGQYEYDGKFLKTIVITDNAGETNSRVEFEHTDGKITTMNIYTSDLDMKQALRPMRLVVPEQLYALIESKACRAMQTAGVKGTKDLTKIPFTLTWDGDNPTKLSTTIMGLFNINITISYDSKTNPFYNLFGMNMLSTALEGSPLMLSKNNPIKMVMVSSFMGESETDEATVTYTYEGNYPVTAESITPATVTETVYDEETGEYVETTTTYHDKTIQLISYK